MQMVVSAKARYSLEDRCAGDILFKKKVQDARLSRCRMMPGPLAEVDRNLHSLASSKHRIPHPAQRNIRDKPSRYASHRHSRKRLSQRRAQCNGDQPEEETGRDIQNRNPECATVQVRKNLPLESRKSRVGADEANRNQITQCRIDICMAIKNFQR